MFWTFQETLYLTPHEFIMVWLLFKRSPPKCPAQTNVEHTSYFKSMGEPWFQMCGLHSSLPFSVFSPAVSSCLCSSFFVCLPPSCGLLFEEVVCSLVPYSSPLSSYDVKYNQTLLKKKKKILLSFMIWNLLRCVLIYLSNFMSFPNSEFMGMLPE